MRRFLCILLTVTMLLGCTGLEFVSGGGEPDYEGWLFRCGS